MEKKTRNNGKSIKDESDEFLKEFLIRVTLCTM